jgi:chromate transporter
VRRRAWLDDREFLDLLSAANLIPGPTSTELAMHIGYRRAGWAGLLAAGLGFLLPASAIVLVLAWAYGAYGAMPQVGAVFAGIAPVVVAIVVHATAALGRAAVASTWTLLVAVGAGVATWVGAPPVAVLLVGGFIGLLRVGAGAASSAGAWIAALPAAVPAGGGVLALGLLELGAIFAKVALLLFGSGYVLVALLEQELVAPGILTRRELLDAVAVGQVTPGPVITTATWIGYVLLGVPGALVATAAIAVPAFALTALSVPVLERLRSSWRARAALDGVAAAVVGTLAVTAAALAREAIVDPITLLLGVGALAALLVTPVNPAVLVAAGAAVGILRGAI